MNRQEQIDLFLLEAHRLAVTRLREEPHRLRDVADLLVRWRQRNGVTRSDAYRDEWSQLVEQGVDAIEQQACAPTDHGAVLRSVSPLSVVITQAERAELLRSARQSG